MRGLILPLLAILPGCGAVGAPGAPLLAGVAVVEGVALRAFGRTTGDAIVSLVTGEDCSIARIGRGEAYCDPNLPPAPQPVCTRSLGAVDCWTVPPAAWPPHRGVADGPATLTEAQENLRIGWPRRLLRGATPPEPAPEPATPVAVIAPAAPLPAETSPPAAHAEPGPRPATRARPAAQAPAAGNSPPRPVIEPAPLPPGPGAGTTAAAAAAAAIAAPASVQPDGGAVPVLPRAAEGGNGGGDVGGAGQR